MPHHWLLLRLTGHGSHPVSHGETIFLRTYLDEHPGDRSDLQMAGGQFVVTSERSVTIPSVTSSRLWLQITEAEYNAGSYDLYLWAEPYAIAAIASPGVQEDIASGRLKLTKSNEKRRGVASGAGRLYGSVAPDDLVITHDIVLANSVVQFIVNEMNTNAQNSDVLAQGRRMAAANEDARTAGNVVTQWYYNNQLETQTGRTEDRLGHHTHKNEGAAGFLQDLYFFGGGHWDHKPVIRPVWGTGNRLGNRHATYYYDGWSNIHFGFIAARMGLPLNNALAGAGQAQGVDNAGGGAATNTATGDDVADAQAITAGHSLGLRTATVTRQNVLNILDAHPGWIGRN
jgi:Bacterial toxin 44